MEWKFGARIVGENSLYRALFQWDFWLPGLTDIGVLQASPAPCIAHIASTEKLDFGPRFFAVVGLGPSWKLEFDIVDLMEVR